MRSRSRVQGGWGRVLGLYGGFAVVAHSPCGMPNALTVCSQVLAAYDTGQAPLMMGSEPTVARCLHEVVVAVSCTSGTVFGRQMTPMIQKAASNTCNTHNACAPACIPLVAYSLHGAVD